MFRGVLGRQVVENRKKSLGIEINEQMAINFGLLSLYYSTGELFRFS
jgi:hypothetical protein